MNWADLTIGIFAGIVFAFGVILGGTVTVLKSPKLSQKFIGKTMRIMMGRSMR